MIWLLVSVTCGGKAVYGPGWVEAQAQLTLANLLEQVSGEESGDWCECFRKDPMHTATLNQPPVTFYSYGDRFVKFSVVSPEEKAPEPIGILMRPKIAEDVLPKHDPVYTKGAF
jgi:hypothetical protein